MNSKSIKNAKPYPKAEEKKDWGHGSNSASVRPSSNPSTTKKKCLEVEQDGRVDAFSV
jgi:hypothetical protein